MNWIDPFALPTGIGAVVIKATLLLACALLAAWALRRAAAGVRHLVWVAVLVAVLALPALGRWTPLAVPVLPPSEVPDGVSAPETRPLPAEPSVSPNVRMEQGAGRAAERSTAAPPSTDVASTSEAATSGIMGIRGRWVLLVLWGVIAAALMGWLVAGALAVRRIVRAARPLGDDRWTAMLYEVADRLDLADAPRLVASDRVEMPFASGVLHPVVVLPATADEWSEDLRRLVLFHELAHVRRRDLLGHTLGRLACALYWFHPLVWTAAKRLRAESEKACDDLVLACGARASDYAEHLLRMVVGVRRFGAPALALPMARRTEFEGRVLAILDPSAPRSARGRWQSASVAAGIAAVALLLSAARPVPRAATASAGGAPNVAGSVDSSVTVQRSAMTAPLATSTDSLVSDSVAPVTIPASTSTTTSTSTGVESRITPNQGVQEFAKSITRAFSQQASGEPASPEQIALLAKLLGADPDADVRRTAAWGLARSVRVDVARDALFRALRADSDSDVREMCAWALAPLVDREEIAVALAEALRSDREESVRETAAWALARAEIPEVDAALVAALRDESSEVRATAIWAIGSREPRRAPAGLTDALNDDDEDVRLRAAWALGQIADPSTGRALLDAFKRERNSDVRGAELRALSFLGEQSKEVLEEALASDDAELRQRAVRMLAGQGTGNWPWPWPWPRPRPSP